MLDVEPFDGLRRIMEVYTMNRYFTILLVACLLAGPALAYDKQLAANYEAFFSAFEEQQLAQALHGIPAKNVVEAIKKGEPLVLMDVRTRKEQSLVGVTYPDTLRIPMNEVFKAENLERIPKDRMVVVTCKSGTRGMVIALALRNIGFDNVYAMKDGILGMLNYLSPKTAF